jgi:hypothetical protein
LGAVPVTTVSPSSDPPKPGAAHDRPPVKGLDTSKLTPGSDARDRPKGDLSDLEQPPPKDSRTQKVAIGSENEKAAQDVKGEPEVEKSKADPEVPEAPDSLPGPIAPVLDESGDAARRKPDLAVEVVPVSAGKIDRREIGHKSPLRRQRSAISRVAGALVAVAFVVGGFVFGGGYYYGRLRRNAHPELALADKPLLRPDEFF